MSEISDEMILARAREIQEREDIGLTDAMIRAEMELAPAPSVPTSFTVEIPVKPRIANWIAREFRPTQTHTTEQRLAAYLQGVLTRARISAIRHSEEAPEIGRNEAVTMTREKFKQKAAQQ